MKTIICEVCGKTALARIHKAGRFCNVTCYRASRRMGHTERFWSKVEKTDGCWYWKGHLDKDGYGRYKMSQKKYMAHRLAYELTYGVSLGENFGCHTCDNPSCVRPDHIFPGTPKSNFADSFNKGRSIHQQLKRKANGQFQSPH